MHGAELPFRAAVAVWRVQLCLDRRGNALPYIIDKNYYIYNSIVRIVFCRASHVLSSHASAAP
jgi:hypothetical protein